MRSYLRADQSEESSALQFELLAAAVPKGQEIRELTMNGIESIVARGGKGSVRWQVDRDTWPSPKLQVIDDGAGFDPVDFETILQTMYVVSKNIGRWGNFGIGGRIAGLKASPAGVVYDSWRHGEGYRMVLEWPDRTGPARPRQFHGGGYVRSLSEPHPWGAESGTRVTLMGETDDTDSSLTPSGLAGGAVGETSTPWPLLYIDRRFCEWPSDVTIQVEARRSEGERTGRLAHGLYENLDQVSSDRGILAFAGFSVRWWVLPPSHDRPRVARYTPSHIGVAWSGELYNSAFSGGHKTQRLDHFGIVLGTSRVAIHVEPAREHYSPDAQRAHLLPVDGDELPWGEWGAAFRSQLPNQIRELEEELHVQSSAGFNADQYKDLLQKLGLLDLRRFYGPSGDVYADVPSIDDTITNGGPPGGVHSTRKKVADAEEDSPSIFDKGTTPRTPREAKSAPRYHWQSDIDADGEIARFAPINNELVCDRDHPLLARLAAAIGIATGASGRLPYMAAQHAMSRRLVEHVMCVEALKDMGWDSKQVQDEWSSRSLTAAVVTQYEMFEHAVAMLRTQKGRAMIVGNDAES